MFDKAETDGQIWRINSPTSTCDWMVFLLLMVLVVTIMSDDDASRCNPLVLVPLLRSWENISKDPGDCASGIRPDPDFTSSNFSMDIRMPGVTPTVVSAFL